MMDCNLKKKEESCNHVERNNYERNIDYTEAIDNMLIDTVVEAQESFYSSTPKQITECEECVEELQC